MPIDFEKLMREGFANKKVEEIKEIKPAFISRSNFKIEDTTDKKKSKKETKKHSTKVKNPQPKLNLDSEDKALSVRMIIDTKPPKKIVIDYIKSKIEMFEDTESEDD
jgi:hypothetical protein